MKSDKILDEYGKYDNTFFSSFSKKELKHFKELLNNYLIEYRNDLELPKKVKDDLSFGCEIEISLVDKDDIERLMLKIGPIMNTILNDGGKNFEYYDCGWDVHTDISTDAGCEVVSNIMEDIPCDWKVLYYVCKSLQTQTKSVHDCGAHVHIGAQMLEGKTSNFRRFLRLYEAFEHIIYRFSYGEYLSERKNVKIYAPPAANLIFDNFWKMYDGYEIRTPRDIAEEFRLMHDQDESIYSGLNMQYAKYHKKNPKNTIEFRMANGTINPIIWQNLVLFYAMLTNQGRNTKLDMDYLNKKVKDNKVLSGDLKEYRKVYFNDALELADIVFDKNIDKINFLRQYSKNFTELDRGMLKAKKFTKDL